MRIVAVLLLAAPLLLASVPGSPCSLTALQDLMASADEHLAWADFWSDLDDRESIAELHDAQHELRTLARDLGDRDCAEIGPIRNMRFSVRSALAACQRREAHPAVGR
jgi:hypothetical protein